MKKTIFSILFLVLIHLGSKAQYLDSLQVQAGAKVNIASKDHQPLWLISNRWGVFTDRQFDVTTHIRVTNSNRFGPDGTIYDEDDRGIYLDYGFDAYNNDQLGNTFLGEAFVKVRRKKLTFSAGRFRQIIGEVDPDLSSGSLGVSGNALPITKLNFSLDYTNVPLTNGWLQVKGLFSHGWMGADQFMKHAYLHEKTIYLRIGKGKFRVYGGVQHYGVWGGSRDDFFTTDRSLKGWLNVVTGIETNDGSVNGNILPNRPGDQRGIIEAGAEWENDDYKFQLNNQTPFDSGQGIDIRNIDRLLSFNFINKKESSILKKLTVEFIHTTQSNDFYLQQYRESYYNNGIYRTGWEYNNRIVGTPLFTNRWRASKYFDEIRPYDWNAPASTIPSLDNIINNRILGGHVGAILSLTDDISSKTLVTYTKNHGDFRVGVFSPYKSQWYTMQEFSWKVPTSQLSFSGAVGYDFGDLSTNIGGMFGVKWQLKN